ncbi:MAG: hypothetical protein ACR2OC_01755 [Solirubrobacterales bacterium]
MRNYDNVIRMLFTVVVGLAGMLAMWFFFALVPLIAFVGFIILYAGDQLLRKRT